MKEKKIRFIDSHYNDLFKIKDGGSIRLVHRDGVEFIIACRYIDDTHCYIGKNVYHICQHAENLEIIGAKVFPVVNEEDCPKCSNLLGDRPALSRRDNKTKICSECGQREAMKESGF